MPATHMAPQPQGPAADMGVADMDGDGKLDIVVSRGVPHQHGTLSILYAQNDGAWREWVSPGPALSYGDLELGDINRDGCLDIAVAVAADEMPPAYRCDGGVQLVLADRVGERCQMPATLPAIEKDIYSVIGVGLGDLDADGWLDLALSRTRSNNCHGEDYVVAVPQGIRLGGVGGFGPIQETQHPLVAAFTAEFLDADLDGRMDVVFGGKGTKIDDKYVSSAFALLYLSTGTGNKEVLLRQDCGEHCDIGELPNLFDIEVLPAKDDHARIATIHTSHQCPSDPVCELRAGARVFELPTTFSGAPTHVLTPTWTSERAKDEDGCAGPLVTLESGRMGPSPFETDLVFGAPVGSQGISAGDLVVIHGTEGGGLVDISARQHHARLKYLAFAMTVADLDGSSTMTRCQHANGGRVVALPEPLHWAPEVKCSGSPSFTYTIDSPYLSVAGCGGEVDICYRQERSADVIYAPKPEQPQDGQALPIRRLTILE